MAIITSRPTVQLNLSISLTEEEARALSELSRYDHGTIIKNFYEKLGSSYLQPHEEGMRSFLKSVLEILPPILDNMDSVRKGFRERL